MNRDSGFSSFYVFCALAFIGLIAAAVVIYQAQLDRVEEFSATQAAEAQQCLDDARSQASGDALLSALDSVEGAGVDPDSYMGRHSIYDSASDFCREVELLVLAEKVSDDAG